MPAQLLIHRIIETSKKRWKIKATDPPNTNHQTAEPMVIPNTKLNACILFLMNSRKYRLVV